MKLRVDLKITDDNIVELFYEWAKKGSCTEAKLEILNEGNYFLFSMPAGTILENIALSSIDTFLGDSIDFLSNGTGTINLRKVSLVTSGVISFYLEMTENLPGMPVFSAGKIGFFIDYQSDTLKNTFNMNSIQC